ncbi:MAG: tRNA (N(6)-L-threonylcarbamoyladenosine(37)-C(2))-methylthiotransferase MtaB [Synergistales bacterium]|nr:tRNA (N(6)-L-threonylcarbamoyladenosine(37)-C(2))-methylthiotransferase MtaB [Synergistales bacterium]
MLPDCTGLRFAIRTLGCRTNLYDAEAVADALLRAGAVLVDEKDCDAAVVLSCTVTAEADRKSRRYVRRIRRENPEAIVVLAGCYAQRIEADHARSLGVDLLVGTREKHRIPELLARARRGDRGFRVVRRSLWPEAPWDPLSLTRPHLHTRAFVKVQEGCDHFCSYCIVPSVRGCPTSRPPEDVLHEVRHLAAAGCVEVVLTGVHLGIYGREWSRKPGLADLVERIAAVRGIRRIRFGSIEPFALDEALLGRLGDVPSFCHHMHIPLQSGDDRVLERMRRGYSASQVAGTVGRVRRLLGDDVHISTDLLVGFPGEDEEAFRRSLRLLATLGVGRVHVFPFSPRGGTAAAAFGERVSGPVIRERCARARRSGQLLLQACLERLDGMVLPVLVERCADGYARGLAPQYVDVTFPGSRSPGEVVDVQVVPAPHGGGLVGAKGDGCRGMSQGGR